MFPFPNIANFFSKLTLKARLLITYLCLSTLILLLTTLFLYKTSKNVMLDNAEKASVQQLSIISNNLSEKIGHITDYAITLSINEEIANLLKQTPTVPQNAFDKFSTNSSLTKHVQRIIGLHKNIDHWDILDTENNWFHASTTKTEDLNTVLTPTFLNSLRSSSEIRFLGPVIVEKEPTFVAVKPITDIDTTKYLGSAVLLIKERNISSAFRDLPESDSRFFYIIDREGQVLSATNSHGVLKDFSTVSGISPNDLSILKEKDSLRAHVHGKDTLAIKKDYAGMDWQVINLIPVKNLNLQTETLLKQIIFICCIIFILSLMFSIVCTRSVTLPIKILAKKMQTAAQGNLDISASYHSNDEISVLYEQFNIMVRKIRTLLDDIYEEQTVKQEMEMKLLQAQVNPHFLYNTLNMIKSLIELRMGDTAIKAISTLSAFYRNSLSKGDFIVPLTKEIELTEQYLYLESLRYTEFSDYEIENRTSYPLERIRIPKLTLQPLLENIYVHAFSTSFCHISITIEDDAQDIIISVSDNGAGIPIEELSNINEVLNNGKLSEKNFGIPSIHWRIRLLYGAPYGLEISSVENRFTTIIIRLPKEETEYEKTSNYRR